MFGGGAGGQGRRASRSGRAEVLKAQRRGAAITSTKRTRTSPRGAVTGELHVEFRMSALARLVLEFDARWPGDAESSMDLPAEEWARLVALAKGETPKPYRVAILACSASKLKGTHPAKDLYTGQLFKLARELAEKVAERFVILSALHGVVLPNEPLGAYDRSIEEAPSDWGTFVADSLSALHLGAPPPQQVLCLAPESYVSKLPVGFAKGWARPLKGKGIGQQKAELKRLAEAA